MDFQSRGPVFDPSTKQLFLFLYFFYYYYILCKELYLIHFIYLLFTNSICFLTYMLLRLSLKSASYLMDLMHAVIIDLCFEMSACKVIRRYAYMSSYGYILTCWLFINLFLALKVGNACFFENDSQ